MSWDIDLIVVIGTAAWPCHAECELTKVFPPSLGPALVLGEAISIITLEW
jgi:hypothetical protein